MGALFSRNVRSPRASRDIDTRTADRNSIGALASAQPKVSRPSTDAFQQFYSKLVQSLPMDDAVFIAELVSNNLLPGDLKNQLKLLHRTSADKAVLFLDSVIEPSVTSDGGSSFDTLLNVMEDSEYQHVKELAKQIRMNTVKKISTTDSGM